MVIGIGGVSRAGKSTLADQLSRVAWKNKLRSKVLHQDVFVHMDDQLPVIKDRVDWEHPDSIQWERLRKEVIRQMAICDLIIVEGLLAFWDPILVEHYNRCLFIEISEETFRTRKEEDLRWGKEPEWYIDHIWSSYLKYGIPAKDGPDLIYINGESIVDHRIVEAFLTTN
ncbi:MAG: hypothetical protein HRU40_08850 [Saprospiraceae bacterium]|nr:hypothetical protein [Saprospiraceae bacterium]